MINQDEILLHLKEKGKDSSLDRINSLINNQNREEVIQTQKDRLRYEIWDKKSEINGIAAPQIIKSRNYAINQAYLIYIDNILVYFQDHNPNVSGYVKMSKKEASKIAEDFIDKKANEMTDNIIANKVINIILSEK